MEKCPTLKDIAKELGVSTTTVYKALKDHPDISKERKEEILEKVKQMNYIPNTAASNLRSKTTRFVGLIVSNNANPYFAKVIRGIEEVLSKEGYFTLIFNNEENKEKELNFINELRGLNVAGVIITPALGDSEGIDLLKASRIPYVLINRYIDQNKDNYVIADDYLAGYNGTMRLISKWHKPVFYLGFTNQVSSEKDRRQGYLDALKDSGIEFKKEWIIPNNEDAQSGYKSTYDIYNNHTKSFSVICYNDYIAIGAIKALQELKIDIPNEAAVLGIDGIEFSEYLYKSLTTMSIDKKEIGVQSAKLLLKILNNDDNIEKEQVIIEPKLIVRETS
jgi:LacI family transcriptional regulator